MTPTQAERSAATRTTLIETARRLFARQGFAETPREQICADAGVTRGALDHHFDGKKGLLRAVVLEIEAEVGAVIAERALAAGPDPREQLRAGCHAYLDVAIDPEVGRVLFLDGRAGLGVEAWDDIQRDHGLGLTIEALRAVFADQPDRPLEPLAQMLLAALNEAAMHVALADNARAAREAAAAEVDAMLDDWLSAGAG